MPTVEEQIIRQAAEDFEKEFHVKVKLFAKVHRKEIGDNCLRQSGWFEGGAPTKPVKNVYGCLSTREDKYIKKREM